MNKKICIDTGLLVLFFDENAPKLIENLWNSVEKKEISVVVLQPTISEAIYHLCRNNGKDYAISKLKSLLVRYEIKIITLDEKLLFQAGILKCQNRETLSYNDCFSISYCLQENIPFYRV